jgi:hypothetical protein
MLTLFDESLLPSWLLESTLGSEHSSSVCLNRNCMNNLILLRLCKNAILQLRFRRQERVAIAICLVLTVGILAGCDDRAVPDPSVFSTSAELMRVSSPNGQLDAVSFVSAERFDPILRSSSFLTFR